MMKTSGQVCVLFLSFCCCCCCQAHHCGASIHYNRPFALSFTLLCIINVLFSFTQHIWQLKPEQKLIIGASLGMCLHKTKIIPWWKPLDRSVYSLSLWALKAVDSAAIDLHVQKECTYTLSVHRVNETRITCWNNGDHLSMGTTCQWRWTASFFVSPNLNIYFCSDIFGIFYICKFVCVFLFCCFCFVLRLWL